MLVIYLKKYPETLHITFIYTSIWHRRRNDLRQSEYRRIFSKEFSFVIVIVIVIFIEAIHKVVFQVSRHGQ